MYILSPKHPFLFLFGETIYMSLFYCQINPQKGAAGNIMKIINYEYNTEKNRIFYGIYRGNGR